MEMDRNFKRGQFWDRKWAQIDRKWSEMDRKWVRNGPKWLKMISDTQMSPDAMQTFYSIFWDWKWKDMDLKWTVNGPNIRALECVRACVRSHACVRNLGCERVRSLSKIVRAKCVRAGFFRQVAPAHMRPHFWRYFFKEIRDVLKKTVYELFCF